YVLSARDANRPPVRAACALPALFGARIPHHPPDSLAAFALCGWRLESLAAPERDAHRPHDPYRAAQRLYLASASRAGNLHLGTGRDDLSRGHHRGQGRDSRWRIPAHVLRRLYRTHGDEL